MDDNILAAQYAQTGDLMDLCNNDAWLRESAGLEDEIASQVEAGLPMKEYARAVNALTADRSVQLRQQMRVQSLLFTGLRQWMETWDLGATFEDTYAIARRLIRAHLANPTPKEQAFIDALLANDAQTVGTDNPTPQKLVAMLSEMFAQEDWQAMAKAAGAVYSESGC